VYIDYSGGNWSEGLTAYMSDHYSNEQQGKGKEYRRKALERYANFAAEGRDFALADFSSRHDEASQAVGYSKSLMLFHMLNNLVGDELFNEGIRQFWQRYRFKSADFLDVITQLYPAGNDEIAVFIEQWLNRSGAPEIMLGEVSVSNIENDYLLSVEILQQQEGPAYALSLPLEVLLADERQPVREQVILSDKQNIYTFRYRQRPREIILDPDYDVFRLLHPQERPASLGRLFGAQLQLLVTPKSADKEQLRAWQELARAWSDMYNNVQLVSADELDVLPENSAVWLLGWDNELVEKYQQRFTSSSQHISAQTLIIDDQRLAADKHIAVLLDPDNRRAALGFIGADNPQSIALMAKKLPHYSSYGVLVFEKDGAKNIIKRHLPVLSSPMARQLLP
jgi:hypothetical protein